MCCCTPAWPHLRVLPQCDQRGLGKLAKKLPAVVLPLAAARLASAFGLEMRELARPAPGTRADVCCLQQASAAASHVQRACARGKEHCMLALTHWPVRTCARAARRRCCGRRRRWSCCRCCRRVGRRVGRPGELRAAQPAAVWPADALRAGAPRQPCARADGCGAGAAAAGGRPHGRRWAACSGMSRGACVQACVQLLMCPLAGGVCAAQTSCGGTWAA